MRAPHRTILAAAAAAALLAPGLAAAATRTVCFELKIADERTNCPSTGTTGAQRACNPGGYSDAVGAQYELWDKDADGNDDFIGTWYIAGTGRRCATFDWEGAAYQNGETNPDVYLKYINTVHKTNYVAYNLVKAVDTGGGDHVTTSWRNGTGGNPDAWVAVDCAAGASCEIVSGGSLVPTNDAGSERGMWVQALDTAQHSLQAYGDILGSDVDLHYPGQLSCPTSCTTDRTNIHIDDSQGDHGSAVAHEMGHIVQMQVFGQDYLRDVCGGSHSTTSVEEESCSTTEGFADYAAGVAWYDPNNSGSVPYVYGMNLETASPYDSTCSANGAYERQVAKAFWDLDDTNNEVGSGAGASWDDKISYSTTYIIQSWGQFANGTGNRDDYESDDDGVNAKDFYYNNSGRYSADFYETFVDHNCLQYQDFN